MASVYQENERKYDGVPERPLTAAELPRVTHLRAVETEGLDAVYFDTTGLRLLRRGITLRRRTGGRDAGWHLKTPGPDGSRTETRLPLNAGDLHHVPQELLARTRADAHGEQVEPVAHLRTRRDLTLLVDEEGEALAELARDTVSARILGTALRAGGNTGNGEPVSWAETEVEVVGGGPELLDEVDAQLRRRGLRPAASPNKLSRVFAAELPGRQDADHGTEHPQERSGERTAERQPDSVGGALTSYLRTQYRELRALDPAVRLDEPDAVHRMRVHVRRLRSALAAHHRVLDRTATDPLDEELRWLGKVLGRARDAEVLGERLGTQAEGLPSAGDPADVGTTVRTWFGDRYREAHSDAVAAMESARYFDLLDVMEQLVARPPLTDRAGDGRAEARRMLRKQRRRTRRRLHGALDRPPGPERDRELHRARKAAKRARYAAESVAGIVPRPAARATKLMKKIQKPLGAHQDGVMGESAVAEIAAAAPGRHRPAFGLGMLHARQRADAPRQVKKAAKACRRLGSGQ
ncbi:CYTH and CHAD domain-containing protein [Kitasatospora herbaricolor]|uniref:CYTH and CHAD domain-containing protein n=1 Tax=Kitasatospora herbaricolor TaxID=68217 RepID=A0ABZ1W261_9ACTN|nr:CYTH and CHAD domain-containing protein [Kitasatospora herbaricolor]